MSLMTTLSDRPWFRRLLVTLAGKPRLTSFLRKSHNCRRTQEALLRRIVRENRDTAFGKDHAFARIRTVTDWRRQVPPGDFEDHRPYVERMMNGEADVLFPGRPLLYNTTSGTTNKPKMIPIRPQSFRDGISGINKLWLFSCMQDNPHIYDGKSLTSVAPAEEGVVADGTPYGSISGLSYRNIPDILKRTYSGPYSICEIPDYDKKYYVSMRFALAEDITIIICPSPSNAIRFHETIMEHFTKLVTDIRNGTIRDDMLEGVPETIARELRDWAVPNPRRADELEALFHRHGDRLRPKHYWPHVAVVNTWVQGNFRLIRPCLDDLFGDQTVIRAFGYQASEARAGIVLGNDWDYSVLAIHLYYFEFVEIDDRDTDDPRFRCAHELETGRRYYLYITNNSGLYRYDMNDIIEVCGRYNDVPLFRFLQKGEGITSITGEKLSEEQVIAAATFVSTELACPFVHYVMACDTLNAHYTFMVELPPHTPEATRDRIVPLMDRTLKDYNPEYRIKRDSRRLACPHLALLKQNSFNQIKERLIQAKVARDGQFKHLYLVKNPTTLDILNTLVE